MAANFFAVSLLGHDGKKEKRGYEGLSQTITNRPLGFYDCFLTFLISISPPSSR